MLFCLGPGLLVLKLAIQANQDELVTLSPRDGHWLLHAGLLLLLTVHHGDFFLLGTRAWGSAPSRHMQNK